jgi:hypothetical protein
LCIYNTNVRVNLVSGITFIRYVQSQKIGESNNLKFFGRKITKEPEQEKSAKVMREKRCNLHK